MLKVDVENRAHGISMIEQGRVLSKKKRLIALHMLAFKKNQHFGSFMTVEYK